MQIDRILCPITTLGPGNRIGIWTIGCPHRCYNCSNPELWDADVNKDVSLIKLQPLLKDKSFSMDGITITGGEPFYQPNELYLLLQMVKKLGYEDALVYSGYKFEYLKKEYPHIIELIDVLVDGPYNDFMNNGVGQKGSSNQRCIVLNSNIKIKYNDFDTKIRKRQNFITNGKIISIGIPE